MANSYYTEHTLNNTIVVDFYLRKIASSCKKSVAHAVTVKVDRLIKVKKQLESELKSLTVKGLGFLKKIKNLLKVRRLQQEISNIDKRMVEWLNVVYTYFLSK